MISALVSQSQSEEYMNTTYRSIQGFARNSSKSFKSELLRDSEDLWGHIVGCSDWQLTAWWRARPPPSNLAIILEMCWTSQKGKEPGWSSIFSQEVRASWRIHFHYLSSFFSKDKGTRSNQVKPFYQILIISHHNVQKCCCIPSVMNIFGIFRRQLQSCRMLWLTAHRMMSGTAATQQPCSILEICLTSRQWQKTWLVFDFSQEIIINHIYLIQTWLTILKGPTCNWWSLH